MKIFLLIHLCSLTVAIIIPRENVTSGSSTPRTNIWRNKCLPQITTPSFYWDNLFFEEFYPSGGHSYLTYDAIHVNTGITYTIHLPENDPCVQFKVEGLTEGVDIYFNTSDADSYQYNYNYDIGYYGKVVFTILRDFSDEHPNTGFKTIQPEYCNSGSAYTAIDLGIWGLGKLLYNSECSVANQNLGLDAPPTIIYNKGDDCSHSCMTDVCPNMCGNGGCCSAGTHDICGYANGCDGVDEPAQCCSESIEHDPHASFYVDRALQNCESDCTVGELCSWCGNNAACCEYNSSGTGCERDAGCDGFPCCWSPNNPTTSPTTEPTTTEGIDVAAVPTVSTEEDESIPFWVWILIGIFLIFISIGAYYYRNDNKNISTEYGSGKLKSIVY